MSLDAFLDRVFRRLPALKNSPTFAFDAWPFADQPTKEGLGELPGRVDVDKVAARVLDVGHYVGNVDHVVECRLTKPATADAVTFYERIQIPLLGGIHMEVELRDFGVRDGFRVLAWRQLDEPTERLDPKKAARSAYNVGAWLLAPHAVGYALSSAPRRDDVGRLKFAALTSGADAGAPAVVKGAIDGMVRWAART